MKKAKSFANPELALTDIKSFIKSDSSALVLLLLYKEKNALVEDWSYFKAWGRPCSQITRNRLLGQFLIDFIKKYNTDRAIYYKQYNKYNVASWASSYFRFLYEKRRTCG